MCRFKVRYLLTPQANDGDSYRRRQNPDTPSTTEPRAGARELAGVGRANMAGLAISQLV